MKTNENELDVNEISNIIFESKPENTLKSINQVIVKFKKWTVKRNFSASSHYHIRKKLIIFFLKKIYAEVKTDKNGMLTPGSMVIIRAKINRTLLSQNHSRSINIISDHEFRTCP